MNNAIINNFDIALKDINGELPDGATIHHRSLGSDSKWTPTNRVNLPYEYEYKLVLPKPSPHPTLLSIIEHGCFPQWWSEWFAVDPIGEIYTYASKPERSDIYDRWRSSGYTKHLFNLYSDQPNWAQQCWTLQELRDIIKQNAAQQGSITQNTVELSEAEEFCYNEYRDLHQPGVPATYSKVYHIGKRIAAQRKAAQS